ncbi:MAG: hypothetical protein WC314_20830 [Vulcanimicrobiota bacterium]
MTAVNSVTWEQLCDASERKFGHAAARVYPFYSMKPLGKRPLVRTHLGPARVVGVVPFVDGLDIFEVVEVVLDSDLKTIEPGKFPKIYRLSPCLIKPPIGPPPARSILAYKEAL